MGCGGLSELPYCLQCATLLFSTALPVYKHMVDSVRITLTDWLGRLGLTTTSCPDGLRVFRSGRHVGAVITETTGDVDVVRIEGYDRCEVVPLCSPLVPDLLYAVFGPASPRWDPNR